MTNMEIFIATAARRMSPEEGARMMLENRNGKGPMTAILNFIKALNRSKVVNGIAAFFALGIPVVTLFKDNLPPTWRVTILIAAVLGVLSRAQYIFMKVVPLLDGSSVVQVKPPTPTSVSGVQPSLVSVAADPKTVAPMPVAK